METVRHKLLVIEDDDALRHSVRRRLTAEGYEVIEAADATEAPETVRRAGVHLVLTDIFMPGRDGIEAILALRRACPEVPVFVMTGSSRDYVEAALEFGACRAFEKPFDLNELVGALRAVLGARGAGRGRPGPR